MPWPVYYFAYFLWIEHITHGRPAANRAARAINFYLSVVIRRTQPRSIRFFRMYLAPEALCFANVRGTLSRKERPTTGLKPIDYLPRFFQRLPSLQRLLRSKPDRYAVYDNLDPASPDFLAVTRENFQIRRETVTALEYLPNYKASRKKWPNIALGTGTLVIVIKDQSPLVMFVSDKLSEPEVNQILQKWELETPTIVELPAA